MGILHTKMAICNCKFIFLFVLITVPLVAFAQFEQPEFCFGECTNTAACGDCYCKERCLQMELGRHGYCNAPVPGSVGKCCCANQAQALSKESHVLGGN